MTLNRPSLPLRPNGHPLAALLFIVLASLIPLSCSEPILLDQGHVDEVQRLIDDGYYREAEARARRLLEDSEGAIPKDPAPDATKALELARAEMMSHLSGAMRRLSQPRNPEVFSLATESLERKIELLGPAHPAVARGYYELGLLHNVRNELDDARRSYEQALQIQEQTPDSHYPATAMTLIRLATLGSSDEKGMDCAVAYLARASEIQSTCLPADHPDVAERLMATCTIYDPNLYTRAKRFAEQGLRMRQRVLRPDHPLIAASHNTLGILLERMGDYSNARKCVEQGLAIYQRSLGDEHPIVASSYAFQAYYFELLGDLAEASRLYRLALQIQTDSYGPDHRRTLRTKTLLANVLRDLGRFDEAETEYEGVISSAEQPTYQPKSDLCILYREYCDFLRATGRMNEAIEVISEAIEVARTNYGDGGLQTLITLQSKARLLCHQGNFAEAHQLLNRINELHEQAEDHDHLLMVESLNDLAVAQAALGDTGIALNTALRSEAASREHLYLTSRTLEAELALSYAASGTTGLHLSTAIASRFASQRSPELERAFNAVIHWRALVLDELVARTRSARASMVPEMDSILLELRLAREQLSALTVMAPPRSSDPRRAEALHDARERKATAERNLAEASAAFRQGREELKLTLSDIIGELPKNAALVSYFRFDDAIGTAPGMPPVPSYLAFIITDQSDDVRAVSLGSAAEVDGLIAQWRAALRGIMPVEVTGAPKATDHLESGRALREMIWDPVVDHLEGTEKLFIVPDAALHLVSFAGIPAEEGGYLIEKGPAIHYITAERDLVTTPPSPRQGNGLLAVGHPEFGSGLPEEDRSNIADAPSSRSGRLDAQYASLRFSPLPQSAEEVEAVASFWRARGDGNDTVTCLTGPEATESEFKARAPGSATIHLATHGFFLDPNPQIPSGGNGGGTRFVTGLPETRVSVSAPDANPLLRTGLALAGANNRRLDVNKGEDGILTAEEIATLDLSGVRLAVLSACDTGLGTVQAGEGVFGLQRAFRLAGVNTVVMSLWPVDDQATRNWMESFYRARLDQDLDMAGAVREATHGLLTDRRARGLDDHPFFWAAFVAAGDWR